LATLLNTTALIYFAISKTTLSLPEHFIIGNQLKKNYKNCGVRKQRQENGQRL
jgi:hypothetical protein